MKNKPFIPLSKQFGQIQFWHILLLILVVVGFALFLNAKGTGFFTRTIPNAFNFQRSAPVQQRAAPEQDYQTYSEPHVAPTAYYPEPDDTDADIWVNEPDTDTPQQQYRQASSEQANIEYEDNLYEAHSPKPSYSYDEQFPPRLSRGYYTVQVFTGYNSKQAYDLRTALKQDGYNSSHIREVRTRKGVLFKVRIGRYKNRYEAFAVRDQIRRRYPKTLGTGFVMLVEHQYD